MIRIACIYPGVTKVLHPVLEECLQKGLGNDVVCEHYNLDYEILFDIIDNYGGIMQAKHREDLDELFGRAISGKPDAIVCTCSSIGEEADRIALQNPDVKIFRIDYPMAKRAVDGFDHIAVMATIETTVMPSVNLVKKVAESEGKEVNVSWAVASGAFQKMMEGKRDEAARNIVETASKLIRESGSQILILAQASMAAFQQAIQEANPDLLILISPDTLASYISVLFSGNDKMKYREL